MFASAEKALGCDVIAANAEALLVSADMAEALSLPWEASDAAAAAELNDCAAMAALARAAPLRPNAENAAWFWAIIFAASALLRNADESALRARKALAFAAMAESTAASDDSADIALESLASAAKARRFDAIAGSLPLKAACRNAEKFDAYLANAGARAAIAENAAWCPPRAENALAWAAIADKAEGWLERLDSALALSATAVIAGAFIECAALICEARLLAACAAAARALGLVERAEKADWFCAIRLMACMFAAKAELLAAIARNALALAFIAEKADEPAPSADIALESLASAANAFRFDAMAGSLPLSAAWRKAEKFDAYFAKAGAFPAIAEKA